VAGAGFVFDPELRARQNFVVIADEAHRTQYGFYGKVNEKPGEMSCGFASNLRDALPNASFIGFTGTSIEKTDANTRAVFGELDSLPGPLYELIEAAPQGAGRGVVGLVFQSRKRWRALPARIGPNHGRGAASLPGLRPQRQFSISRTK